MLNFVSCVLSFLYLPPLTICLSTWYYSRGFTLSTVLVGFMEKFQSGGRIKASDHRSDMWWSTVPVDFVLPAQALICLIVCHPRLQQ